MKSILTTFRARGSICYINILPHKDFGNIRVCLTDSIGNRRFCGSIISISSDGLYRYSGTCCASFSESVIRGVDEI